MSATLMDTKLKTSEVTSCCYCIHAVIW